LAKIFRRGKDPAGVQNPPGDGKKKRIDGGKGCGF